MTGAPDLSDLLDEIEVIFFDFDGVILESNEVKIDAFKHMYAPYGEDVVKRVLQEHVRHEGVSRVVKLERFHREFLGIKLDPAGLDGLAQEYSNLVEDVVCGVDPVPGAMDMLAAWLDRAPMYVVSGTPQDELRRITDRRGLSGYFTAVFGSPRVKTDIVGTVLGEIGIAPARALFVGDSMTDHDAARAVGARFLGRVPGWRKNCFPDGTTVVEDMRPMIRAA
ncbi:MAG: HAD family hydrolase [Rhodospirillaceae bacterium]